MIYTVLGSLQFLFIGFSVQQGDGLRLFSTRDAGKRLGLLGGQDQILRLGAGKGCIAVADVIVIAARCSRCSTSSKSRVVKRSPPRTSYPCATGSGALRMAPSTALNWPGPSP